METPLRIAICEDSREDEEKLLNVLKNCSVSNEPQVFRNGESLLESYRPGQYDLLLSDIYMDGITGVDTVTEIRRRDLEIPVAFITSSREFALESYRLSALKYIEKPFQQKDIEEILILARMKRDSAPSLFFQQNGREVGVKISGICYFEQKVHQLNVVSQDSCLSVYERLAVILPQLEKAGFYSPHKSYAVNLDHVMRVDTEYRCFVMSNGANVPIRRESLKKAQVAFEEHLFRKTREG